MRIWKDPSGNLVDDQRLLAYLSAHGSLSKALASGDFVLVSDSGEVAGRRSSVDQSSRCPRLADYL